MVNDSLNDSVKNTIQNAIQKIKKYDAECVLFDKAMYTAWHKIIEELGNI